MAYYVANGFGGTVWVSNDGYNWSTATDSPLSSALRDGEFGFVNGIGNTVVATGHNGYIATGIETYTESSYSGTEAGNLTGVARNDDPVPTWVAVGQSNTIIVTDQPDSSWSVPSTVPTSFPGSTLTQVDHHNGTWIAVGGNGNVARSTDPFNTWTDQSFASMSASVMWGVDHGNGRWVMVGEGGHIAYSDDDGLNWSEATSSTSVTINRLLGVHYSSDAGRWVAVGDDAVIIHSSDGDSWSQATDAPGSTNGHLANVGHDGSKWIAVGNGGQIWTTTSSNANGWTQQTTPSTDNLRGIAITTPDIQFMVGGGTNELYVSENATSWDLIDLSPQLSDDVVVNAVGYDGLDGWVGAGYLITESSGYHINSSDGLNWSITTTGIMDIIHDLKSTTGSVQWDWVGLEEASTGVGSIDVSSDGTSFTNPQNDDALNGEIPYSVDFGNGTYVIAAANGTIIYSTDGDVWSSASSVPTSVDLKAVKHNTDQLWIAVGNGTILTSSDADTWTEVTSPGVSANWEGIEFGGDDGRWIAVGDNGTIATSIDGTNWSEVTDSGSITTDTFYDIAYHQKSIGTYIWVAITQFDIYTSSDGDTWTQQQSIANGDGHKIGIAEDGATAKDYANVSADQSTIVVNGLSPTVTAVTDITVNADLGSLHVNGLEPSLGVDVLVDTDLVSTTINGLDPSLTVIDNSAEIQSPLGNVTFNGLDPDVFIQDQVTVSADLGSISLVLFVPQVQVNAQVDLSTTPLLVINTFEPTLSTNKAVEPPTGTLVLNGFEPREIWTGFINKVLSLNPYLYYVLDEPFGASTASDETTNNRDGIYGDLDTSVGDTEPITGGLTPHGIARWFQEGSYLEFDEFPWSGDPYGEYTIILYHRQRTTSRGHLTSDFLVAHHPEKAIWVNDFIIPDVLGDGWDFVVLRAHVDNGETFLTLWVNGFLEWTSDPYFDGSSNAADLVPAGNIHFLNTPDLQTSIEWDSDIGHYALFDYALSETEIKDLAGAVHITDVDTLNITIHAEDPTLWIPSLAVPVQNTPTLTLSAFEPEEIVPRNLPLWIAHDGEAHRLALGRDTITETVILGGAARDVDGTVDKIFAVHHDALRITIYDFLNDQNLSIPPLELDANPLEADPWAVAVWNPDVGPGYFATGTRYHDQNFGDFISGSTVRLFNLNDFSEVSISSRSGSVRDMVFGLNKLFVGCNDAWGLHVLNLDDMSWESSGWSTPPGKIMAVDVADELYIGYRLGVWTQDGENIGKPYTFVEDISYASTYALGTGRIAVVGEQLYVIELDDLSITTLRTFFEEYARAVEWYSPDVLAVGFSGINPAVRYFDASNGDEVSVVSLSGATYAFERRFDVDDSGQPDPDAFIQPSSGTLQLNSFDPSVGPFNIEITVPNTPTFVLNSFDPTVETLALVDLGQTGSLVLNGFESTVDAPNVTIHLPIQELVLNTFSPSVDPLDDEITVPSTLVLDLNAFDPTLDVVEQIDAVVNVGNQHTYVLAAFDPAIHSTTFEIVLTDPLSSIVTAKDATPLGSLDLGTLFTGQQDQVTFCVGNTGISKQSIFISSVGDTILTDLVEFSQDGVTWESDLVIRLQPNEISEPIIMRMKSVPMNVPVGENEFAVALQTGVII